MEFNTVQIEDYQFLYELLVERDPVVNISHKKMPTWEEHCLFLGGKPYRVHWIITDGKERVGTCYLSYHNEIGIFIKKEFQRKGYGKRAIKSMINDLEEKEYLANINPKNKKSIKLFEGLGFKHIQNTYKL